MVDAAKRSAYDNYGFEGVQVEMQRELNPNQVHAGFGGGFGGGSSGGSSSARRNAATTTEDNVAQAASKLVVEHPKTMLAVALSLAGAGAYMSYNAHKHSKDPSPERENERSTHIAQNVLGLGLMGGGIYMGYKVGSIPDKKGKTWGEKIFAKAEESATRSR